jgi:hypothetical protein
MPWKITGLPAASRNCVPATVTNPVAATGAGERDGVDADGSLPPTAIAPDSSTPRVSERDPLVRFIARKFIQRQREIKTKTPYRASRISCW